LCDKDDYDVGIVDGILMLYKNLTSKKDNFIFGITCFFLWFSSYFDVYANLLTGYVLNSFNESDSKEVVDNNYIPRYMCDNFF
jgi:hypothetical protein